MHSASDPLHPQESRGDQHLEPDRQDAEKSLAALSSSGSVRQDVSCTGDADPQASLAPVSRGSASEADTLVMNQGLSGGKPTSAGQRFRILRPHRKGGLGEVFVARDEELPREVALKQIQGRFAHDPERRTRFVLEAEITGALEHPGVVPVYGLGYYSDGRPFYAMRFIKGDSLKEAIERFYRPATAQQSTGEHNLEFRELLGRFVDVCNAVAYAHSKSVLHRDLKPGNIMLGPYGETLVVDWGLAKVLGRPQTVDLSAPNVVKVSAAAGSTPTEMGSVVGTPQFMSPEQAAGRLDRLGPSSDVYSLGATLYCLLTGKVPFDGTNHQEVLARVIEGHFARPREVNRTVPPALESICLKAMALQPADRYPTAQTLATDVEHWLADEPVTAHRESLRERLARWERRHRAVVVAAAAIAAVVLLCLTSVVVFLARAKEAETQLRIKAVNEEFQANRAREEAETQRQIAEQRAREATEFSQFLRSLFFAAEPIGLQALGSRQALNHGPDTTARELLRIGVEKVQSELNNAPLARASVLDSLGNVYASLAMPAEAEKLVLEADTIRQRHHAGVLDLAASRHSLAIVRLYQGKFDEAEALFRQALAMRRKAPDPDDPLIADTSLWLAAVLCFENVADRSNARFDEAERLADEVLRIRRARFGDDHRDVAIVYLLRGFVWLDRGKSVDGLASIQRGLASLGAPDLVSQTIKDIVTAVFYQKSGQSEKAVALLDRAVGRARDWIGQDHPFTLLLQGFYAGELHRIGRDEEAVKTIYPVLKAVQRTPFRYHPKVLEGLLPLADYELSKQHYAQAEALYREALEVARRSKKQDKVRDISRKLNEAAQPQKSAGKAGYPPR